MPHGRRELCSVERDTTMLRTRIQDLEDLNRSLHIPFVRAEIPKSERSAPKVSPRTILAWKFLVWKLALHLGAAAEGSGKFEGRSLLRPISTCSLVVPRLS